MNKFNQLTSSNLQMLSYILRLAIEETSEIIGDQKTPTVRISDLGKRD